MRKLCFALALILLFALMGCASEEAFSPADDGKLSVVTTNFPSYDFARALGGDAATFAFLCKLLFTAVTIGFGFKCGEIVPTFFIGAALGFALPKAAWIGEFGKLFVDALKAIAPILVFVLVASSLANSKGGSNGSNVGTVALEQTSAAPIDGGATLPLDPNQGTLPLDPNANIGKVLLRNAMVAIAHKIYLDKYFEALATEME